ncbi:hypothetical protein [Companilactobacillus furfuricola]|nr:hypothetical protein [Companilactobacillus furfuricola]
MPVPGRGAIWDWNVADIDLNYPGKPPGHFKYESSSKLLRRQEEFGY